MCKEIIKADDIPEIDHIQRICLPIFRGNFLKENSSQNNIRRISFQKIREDVHSHFLTIKNYYNTQKEVEKKNRYIC